MIGEKIKNYAKREPSNRFWLLKYLRILKDQLTNKKL